MRKPILFVALLSVAAQAAPSGRPLPRVNETPLQFVTNYVTQLATFQNIRRNALQEMKTESAPGMACVHNNTRYDLESAAAVVGFRRTHLIGVDADVQKIPSEFADFYELRQKTMGQMTTICSAFAEGPKEGVDYKGLVAILPKLRAQLEYLDNSITEASPLIFATLISDVPDSKGHTSHLVITCDERKGLVSHIDDLFGQEMSDKEVSSEVQQARMIRTKVLEFKCADEPR